MRAKYCSGFGNLMMMCAVSSWIGEYSSSVPDGLRVTLDCQMTRILGQIGNN